MILTCPACQKKYLIPDSAIGVDGRQVRCAACRHSWFEEARDLVLQPETAPPPRAFVPVEPEEESPAPVAPPSPPSWTSPAQNEPEIAPVVRDAEPEDHYDPYAPEPPFQPRRNITRRWTIAAVIASLLLIGGIGYVYYFASPSILARLGLPIGEVDTPLITQFNTERGPKAGMPEEKPYVAIHGQIINPTNQPQRVPDLIAELLDAHGRVVYSWTIAPTQRTIAPKGTLPIDNIESGIPESARVTRLTFSGVDLH